MVKRTLKPGQIWVGKCLSSYEPNFFFEYILLSADTEDDILWWSAACFSTSETNTTFGAQVRKFTEEEIRKLSYSGYVAGNWFRTKVRKILLWLKEL